MVATQSTRSMLAIRNRVYGAPKNLVLERVAIPAPDAGEVLVRVRAASVNPYDWHAVRGRPYIARLIIGLRPPNRGIPGGDAAGIVEAVGEGVTEFRPGDEVVGRCRGAFAEYAVALASQLVQKPDRLSFEEAAAIPMAGITALQAVCDHAAVKDGQRVVVNGAAGGVGSFAVQLAKSCGAHVTGVCSARGVELVRSIGADEVIEYDTRDFTELDQFDVIIDTVGNRPIRELRRAMVDNGALISVGGGGLSRKLATKVTNRFVTQHMVGMFANLNHTDLRRICDYADSGEIRPAVGRRYVLDEAADAIELVEGGHATGKVILTTPR